MKIADLRQDYLLKSLDRADVAADPIEQFNIWFDEAVVSQILEPNAMILATVGVDGKPSARVVLLKDVDTEGFVFYTNYESRKGFDLAINPYAALCFNWLDLQRQVRIEGEVTKVAETLSDAYFQSRPHGSRIGAWVSPQSQVIESRTILEEKEIELNQKYTNSDFIPRPTHWGGYVLKPTLIEFWQGRSSRLHDRIQYSKTVAGDWQIERLAP
jgi:pyridoxamine 5'-phosphate oxidase